jgi:putative transcription antitermination factor YqgF|tara:strand:+ start:759 stop:1136 length:378 start_codon:yes stop_codon:yes gene_type:complete
MNVLGIDYGERYIGCAISTAKTKLPFALKVIDTNLSNIVESLASIIDNYEVTKIAIGFPIGLNNNETRMSNLVDVFIKDILNPNFTLDVIKVDERMTSSLITKSKKDRIDDISALQILETYLSNV